MKELHTQMDKYGRLLIPSQVRHFMGYTPGDTFVIRANEDALYIVSLDAALKSAQKLVKERNNSNISMTDEFLAQKSLEACDENKYD